MMILEKYEKSNDFSIDGKFNDWYDIPSYKDSTEDQLDNDDVNLIDYKISSDNLFISFYLKVKGKMFGYLNIEKNYVVQIFIDTDLDENTGYLISQIGADYMIEISGNKNNIMSSMYYQFDESRVNNDWNAWEVMFEVESDSNENELETQIWLDDLDLNKGNFVNTCFHIFDSNGNEDFSDMIISNQGNALTIEQKSLPPIIIEKGKPIGFLELNIKDFGEDVIINSIIIESFSTVVDDDIDRVELFDTDNNLISFDRFNNGFATLKINHSILSSSMGGMTVVVAVNFAETATSGHAIGIKVSSVDANTNAITINGKTKVSYIEKVPEGIEIDGAFEDWKDISGKKDPDDVKNKNIDINDYRSTKDTELMSFYLDVEGEMLAGVRVPSDKARVVPSKPVDDIPSEPINTPDPPSEEVPLPEKTGEDKIYIFIDSDNENDTGYRLSFFPIGADYMIEITGQYGNILSSRYYIYSGEDEQEKWSWKVKGKVKVAIEDKKLEGQISIEDLGLIGEFRVYFHTVDWENNEDYTSEISPINIELDFDILPKPDGTRATVLVIGHVYYGEGESSPVEKGTLVRMYVDGDYYGCDVTGDSWDNETIGPQFDDHEYAIRWDDGGSTGQSLEVKCSTDGWTGTNSVEHTDTSTEIIDIHLVPEFSEMTIPIIGIIVLFIISRRKRRKKENIIKHP